VWTQVQEAREFHGSDPGTNPVTYKAVGSVETGFALHRSLSARVQNH
jgi:hypothetical protein